MPIDEDQQTYKSRMKRLLWTIIPETYLSKKSDGTPNPEYNRYDPRVSGQDARRMITISQRLTDCELSRAPQQHVPELDEMTKRLGMLHSYAILEPAKEEKKKLKKWKSQKKKPNTNPWEVDEEDSDDDENNPILAKPGERGLTMERRRRERWLRLQREKRNAVIKAEEEARTVPKRGIQFAPINSKVLHDHQKLKAHEAKLALKGLEEEAEKKRLLALAPPSNLLATRHGHANYHGPRRLLDGDDNEDDECASSDTGNEAKKATVSAMPLKPLAPLSISTLQHTKVPHNEMPEKVEKRKNSFRRSRISGVLQPPEGSIIANVGVGSDHQNGRTSFTSPQERKEKRKKDDIESEADIVFKMANGKHPLLFRQHKKGILSDDKLRTMRDKAADLLQNQYLKTNTTTPETEVGPTVALDILQNDENEVGNGFSASTHRKSSLLLMQRRSSSLTSARGILSMTTMAQSASVRASSQAVPTENPYGLIYDPLFSQSAVIPRKERRKRSINTSEEKVIRGRGGSPVILGAEGSWTDVSALNGSGRLTPHVPSAGPIDIYRSSSPPVSPSKPPPSPATMDQCYIIEPAVQPEDLGEKLHKMLQKAKLKKQAKNETLEAPLSDNEKDVAVSDPENEANDQQKGSPTRIIWRAPKKSRWMKEFDTALMVSEALHFVDDLRSKPTVARCAPNETASPSGELSARAVVPSPLRLSVPVKRAQETREKLELAHMTPVIGADGTDALAGASILRSPQHSKIEAQELLASRPQPTRARTPVKTPEPQLSASMMTPSKIQSQIAEFSSITHATSPRSPRCSSLGGRLSPLLV